MNIEHVAFANFLAGINAALQKWNQPSITLDEELKLWGVAVAARERALFETLSALHCTGKCRAVGNATGVKG